MNSEASYRERLVYIHAFDYMNKTDLRPIFNLVIFSRVLKALTRKFKLDENISLLSIAKKCPPNFTGADMYALCADAWFHAAKRKVSLDLCT